MKKIVLLFFSMALLSCSDDDRGANTTAENLTGNIDISYSGKRIVFENPDIIMGGHDSEFDLTIRGYITFEGSHQIKNYIRLPFNMVDGQYQLQQIDLNDNQFDGVHLDILPHYVMLAGELNDPTFNRTTTFESNNHLVGSFSGTMQPGTQEPEETPALFVSGNFDINLTGLN